jgi:hypothetical protein
MTAPATLRLWLLVLAVPTLVIGAWALLAPGSFYDDFPGAGLTWVSRVGEPNAHLTTDFGGLMLALGVLYVLAARSLSRPLVIGVLVAQLVSAVPHNVFHLTHLDGYPAADAVSQMLALAAQLLVPAALLVHVVRATTPA